MGPRAWRAGARSGSGAAEDGERHGGDRLLPLLRLGLLGACLGRACHQVARGMGGAAGRGAERLGRHRPAEPRSPRRVQRLGVDGGEMSGPLRRRYREDWPGARDGALSAAQRLEKGAAGRWPPPRRACRSWTARPMRSTTNAHPCTGDAQVASAPCPGRPIREDVGRDGQPEDGRPRLPAGGSKAAGHALPGGRRAGHERAARPPRRQRRRGAHGVRAALGRRKA